MKKATIKDIANKAGVSPTTVSLVLNGRTTSVSERTVERIRSIAEEMNYHPNHIARSLVTKETKTIGLVIPNIGNPFFASLALALEGAIASEGYQLLLTNTNENYKKDIEHIKMLSARGIDGLLIALSPVPDEGAESQVKETINTLDIPVVAIDRWIEGLACNRASIDHSKGAYLAVKHLIDAGHERIATVTGPLSTYTGIKRLDGYKTALAEASLPYEEELVFTGDYTFEKGCSLGPQVFAQSPTAVFAANDMMAIGLLRSAREQGIAVPDDLSVIGFDNLLMAALVETPLTTVNQPLETLGRRAVKLLFDKMRLGKTLEHDVELEPEVIIRSTTSPRRRKDVPA